MMKIPPFLEKKISKLWSVFMYVKIFLPHESQLIILILMNYVLEDYRLILCKLCSYETETVTHVFWRCQYVTDVWSVSIDNKFPRWFLNRDKIPGGNTFYNAEPG
ncbi:hypothetical protein ACB098_11G193900 [Castanea mollissima]